MKIGNLQETFETFATTTFRWYLRARHTLHKIWPPTPPETWKLLRVYAFCEDDNLSQDEADFVDLSFVIGWPSHEPETWKAYIVEKKGWTKFKIEVRYLCRGKKHRAILRHDEDFAFPPCAIDAVNRHGRLHSPDGLLLGALIHTREGQPLDVTEKLRKYEGVLGDFHGNSLYCHDLFPFDNNEDNAARMNTLTVYRISCSKGIDAHTYDFSQNDKIN